MSESSKPTPGPWKAIAQTYDSSAYYIFAAGAPDKRSPMVAHIPRSKVQPMEANAKLIAEAGTVFHETGLTPRGLVEQIEQLREALKLLDDAYCNVSPVMSREDRANGRHALIKTRAALANTERKTS